MYDIGFRAAALRAYEYTGSLRKTANLLRVSLASVYRWCCRRILPTPWTHTPRKATQQVIETIRAICQKASPVLSATDIVHTLEKEHGVRISRQLAYLILSRKLGFSFKRTRKRPRLLAGKHEQECERQRERRDAFRRFCKAFVQYNAERKLVAIDLDECGFDQRCVPVYAYAPKGQVALVHANLNSDRRRYTLMMAIASDPRLGKTRHQLIVHRKCTSHTFATFLASLPFPVGTGIVLDNAPIHRTKHVAAAADRKGYRLLFLPPYTPEANPIEMVFGNVKNTFYKTRYSPGFRDLYEAIVLSLQGGAKDMGIYKSFEHVHKCILTDTAGPELNLLACAEKSKSLASTNHRNASRLDARVENTAT